jgi:hypothetical protein
MSLLLYFYVIFIWLSAQDHQLLYVIFVPEKYIAIPFSSTIVILPHLFLCILCWYNLLLMLRNTL